MTNSRTARSAREKAAELRAEAERAEGRRRTMIVTGAVLGVLLVVVATVVIVKVAQKNQADQVAASTPANTTDYGITVGQASAKVTITAYEDFLCPVCRQYETDNKAQLEKWIADGTAKVVYKPISILDDRTTTPYSSRAAGAAGAVVATDPTKFLAFHDLLFANQPAEGSSGLPDSRLVDLAVQAGVPRASVESAITSAKYQKWALAATDEASKAGINSTPTILVNGKSLAPGYVAPDALRNAVTAAAK